MIKNIFCLFVLFLFIIENFAAENWEWVPTSRCREIKCPIQYRCHRPRLYTLPVICVKNNSVFDGIYPPMESASVIITETSAAPKISPTTINTEEATTQSKEVLPTIATQKISNDDISEYQLEILRLILIFVTVSMFFSFYVFVRMCKI